MSSHELGEYFNFIAQMTRIGMISREEAESSMRIRRFVENGPSVEATYRGVDLVSEYSGEFSFETMYSENGQIIRVPTQPVISEGHDYPHEQRYYTPNSDIRGGLLGTDGSILIKIGNDYSEV